MAERTARKERRFTGGSVTQNIVTTEAVAETIQLIPTLADVQGVSLVTHKLTWLAFSIRRNGVATSLDTCNFIVWKGKTLVATTTPAQPAHPLADNLAADGQFKWADKDIMLFGSLPIPAVVLIPSTDAAQISGEVIVANHEVRAMRKFSRANHGIFLQMAANVTGNLEVRVTWRSLFLV